MTDRLSSTIERIGVRTELDKDESRSIQPTNGLGLPFKPAKVEDQISQPKRMTKPTDERDTSNKIIDIRQATHTDSRLADSILRQRFRKKAA